MIYYIVPHKFQWIVLLGFQLYLLYSRWSTLCCLYSYFPLLLPGLMALFIEKSRRKREIIKVRSKLLILGLILNFGMLGIVKYTNFAVENINALFHLNLRGDDSFCFPWEFLFIHFSPQDIFWMSTGKGAKQKSSPFKYALFVSFFPQILQGPIGRYSRLADQLYAAT